MTTFTAAIATASDIVEYAFCDVAVAEDDIITYKVDGDGNETPVYGMSNRIALEPVVLPVRVDDDDKLTKATHAADEILAVHGWSVTGDWEIVDNAMYAAVERA